MKQNKGFIQEFKEFITKGNVMDLAIGVIIGSAFTIDRFFTGQKISSHQSFLF